MTALKIWVDAQESQPILVFASGFLTEAEINEPLQSWTESILRFATERGWSAAGVYWGSRGFRHLAYDYKDARSIPFDIVTNWRSAKENIETAALKLKDYLSAFKGRDIYLVGHSLGARLWLRVCEILPKHSIKKLILLAPACKQTDFDFNKITEANKEPTVCFYSKDDFVLTKLYPLAESPQAFVCSALGVLPLKIASVAIVTQFGYSKMKNKALGAYVHKIKNFKFVDASDKFNRSIGHLTYMDMLYPILKSEI